MVDQLVALHVRIISLYRCYFRHIGDLGTIREDAARDGRSTGAFTIPDFPDIMGEFGILGRSVFVSNQLVNSSPWTIISLYA